MKKQITRWLLACLAALMWITGCTHSDGATQVVNVEPDYPPVIAIEPFVDAEALITFLTNAGDGSGRLFLLTRSGLILLVKNGRLERTPFLDIRELVDSDSIEQGLLGLAFDPEYAETGEFYVYFTSRESDNDTIVARYRVSDDPDLADPASYQQILFVEQPANNHNAGQLYFGADAYLYIGLGDGGPGYDRKGYAQNPESLLGKILRLDVRGQETYAIPQDNPFVGVEEYRPEIWALGLRNPWRSSFDPVTGEFYLGDVGEEQWEELNFVEAPGNGGMNFGWNILEGKSCFSPPESCNQDGLAAPIFDYKHGEDGCSIIAGNVYRGQLHPTWAGAFFFGDFCTGLIRGAWRDPDGNWVIEPLLDTDLAIVSFGLDEAGEFYVLDLQGAVYRIIERSAP